MCSSSTLWHLLTEGFALAPSSWRAPLPHPTPHSALATACSSFPLSERMPLSLEACLPSHQAPPLKCRTVCPQPSAHLPTCTIDELLNLQPRAPRGQPFHVCLVQHVFLGTEPGAQRVLSKGFANSELAGDPLRADSSDPPTTPGPSIGHDLYEVVAGTWQWCD